MLERGEAEQYEVLIEERSRQKIVEELKEIKLPLQTQAASQEQLVQLREDDITSVKTQVELRIKDVESELSRIKTSQADNQGELERYKALYLEEVKSATSLSEKNLN
ncbi:hypothetical protein P7K49_030284 [Saguinus oedipus]|uniref:DUF3496 domain-containing protein n=1 Tax=Saguinus oedipus TaxID=9490 RepID=A0ABQ9U2P6_SAGOE|nr:hypothetical protein P7K49_030284 [Saguinus oedipus]